MGRKRNEPDEQPQVVDEAVEPDVAETPAEAPEAEETVIEPEAAREPAPEAGEPEAAVEAAEAENEPNGEAPVVPVPEVDEPAPQPRKAPARKAAKPKAEKKAKPRLRAAHSAERKPLVRIPRPERSRGKQKERRGVVVSSAMDKTIVVRVDSTRPDRTYKKVVRRSRKFHAHDERNEAKLGDLVRIVETRPLSKTKSWRLVEILEAAK